jgi:hypothetical protein
VNDFSQNEEDPTAIKFPSSPNMLLEGIASRVFSHMICRKSGGDTVRFAMKSLTGPSKWSDGVIVLIRSLGV